MIGEEARRATTTLRERFRSAQPFPYVVIDGFLQEGFARALHDQFPVNTQAGQVNEFGAPGIKVVHSDLTALGGAYRQAHEFFGSREFLEWMSAVTGVDGLLYDPENYGGGTHENLPGRDLRPHVDFNVHPLTKLHRRINLIVYLNERWNARWGGNITLHSDPRSSVNQTTSFEPIFNRCIIFETSERSWHGFDLIDLPPQEQGNTRKSLSIYLYSRERPENEIHPEHTTFFIPEALPTHLAVGHTLTEDDLAKLDQLFGQRDRLIALYQREQGRRGSDTAQAARLRITVAELLANRPIPMMGYVRPEGGVSGLYPDGWSGAELQFSVRAVRAVRALEMRAIIPQQTPGGAEISVEVDGRRCAQTAAIPGPVVLSGPTDVAAGSIVRVRIACSATVNHKALGLSADERDLGFYLDCITFEDHTA